MDKKLIILQIVKTVDGAQWALEQVKVLIGLGHEVHIVLNSKSGKFIKQWKSSGAIIHFENLDFPIRNIFTLGHRIKAANKLIKKINPSIIHSHFFGTTIVLRRALKNLTIPLVFQVPGPLHLENFLFRAWEIFSSNKNDYWIASSQYIRNLYLKANIPAKKVFLSYYGSDYSTFTPKSNQSFRKRFNFSNDDFIIGNVSYIYAPKYHLFQFTGLKNHELIIKTIAKLNKTFTTMKGLLVGGQWGGKSSYEERLRQKAKKLSSGSIVLTGRVEPWEAHQAWNNLDLAIHLPNSENCGGVLEPLLCGVPVVCSRTGGLPEVIIDKVTGYLVDSKTVDAVSNTIYEVYNNPKNAMATVERGQKLVKKMFDVNRTAKEVEDIYYHILGYKSSPPTIFDPVKYLNGVSK